MVGRRFVYKIQTQTKCVDHTGPPTHIARVCFGFDSLRITTTGIYIYAVCAEWTLCGWQADRQEGGVEGWRGEPQQSKRRQFASSARAISVRYVGAVVALLKYPTPFQSMQCHCMRSWTAIFCRRCLLWGAPVRFARAAVQSSFIRFALLSPRLSSAPAQNTRIQIEVFIYIQKVGYGVTCFLGPTCFSPLTGWLVWQLTIDSVFVAVFPIRFLHVCAFEQYFLFLFRIKNGILSRRHLHTLPANNRTEIHRSIVIPRMNCCHRCCRCCHLSRSRPSVVHSILCIGNFIWKKLTHICDSQYKWKKKKSWWNHCRRTVWASETGNWIFGGYHSCRAHCAAQLLVLFPPSTRARFAPSEIERHCERRMFSWWSLCCSNHWRIAFAITRSTGQATPETLWAAITFRANENLFLSVNNIESLLCVCSTSRRECLIETIGRAF